MRAVKAKPLNKFSKRHRKEVQKEIEQQKLRDSLPKNTGHSSKKRHKNETVIDFKERRKKVNKAKRERRKLRHAGNKQRSARA